MASATIDIEVCKKVERKFRYKETDSLSLIYARALEEAARDVVLTAEDYREIADEIEQNRRARDARRNARISR